MTIKEFETILNELLKGKPADYNVVSECLQEYLTKNFPNGNRVHTTYYGRHSMDVYYVNEDSYRVYIGTVNYHLKRANHEFVSLDFLMNITPDFMRSNKKFTIEGILEYAEDYKSN